MSKNNKVIVYGVASHKDGSFPTEQEMVSAGWKQVSIIQGDVGAFLAELSVKEYSIICEEGIGIVERGNIAFEVEMP